MSQSPVVGQAPIPRHLELGTEPPTGPKEVLCAGSERADGGETPGRELGILASPPVPGPGEPTVPSGPTGVQRADGRSRREPPAVDRRHGPRDTGGWPARRASSWKPLCAPPPRQTGFWELGSRSVIQELGGLVRGGLRNRRLGPPWGSHGRLLPRGGEHGSVPRIAGKPRLCQVSDPGSRPSTRWWCQGDVPTVRSLSNTRTCSAETSPSWETGDALTAMRALGTRSER